MGRVVDLKKARKTNFAGTNNVNFSAAWVTVSGYPGFSNSGDRTLEHLEMFFVFFSFFFKHLLANVIAASREYNTVNHTLKDHWLFVVQDRPYL